MRILGIDPGSRKTGFGIIDIRKRKNFYVESGCLYLPEAALPERLKIIYQELSKLIKLHQPDILSIEQVFMHKNANSALKLGHARGAAMCAALIQDLEVFEYSARQIKQAVVGYGAAEKSQVQQMVKILLCLDGLPQEDAADALAAALCHSQQAQTLILDLR